LDAVEYEREGRDFSRAANAPKRCRALAPAVSANKEGWRSRGPHRAALQKKAYSVVAAAGHFSKKRERRRTRLEK